MRLVRRLISLSTAALFGASAWAVNPDPGLVSLIAQDGCVIGPETRATARAEGFTTQAIDALVEHAMADPDSLREGAWLVVSSRLCQIPLPTLPGKRVVSDIELKVHVSAPDDWDAEGLPGCFLDSGGLGEHLRTFRGWDEATADRVHIRFLARSLIEGRLAFYSDSPLVTPPGFIVIDGSCDVSPTIPVARRENEILRTRFDTIIRAAALQKECEKAGSMIGAEIIKAARDASGQEVTNAWLGFQVDLIAMAAGWIEETPGSRRGTQRPPLCHYK